MSKPLEVPPAEDRSAVANGRSFSFAAKYSAVPSYLRVLETSLHPDVSDERTFAALAEALSNAIVHGALGIPGRAESDDLTGYILTVLDAEQAFGDGLTVEVTVSQMTDGAVIVEIVDSGPGFDWRAAPARRGRGLGIMREVASELSWNDVGNRLRLRFEPSQGRRARLGAGSVDGDAVPEREAAPDGSAFSAQRRWNDS
jgi:anti-sigma regulatory factor (Ser/Thr protein kinase)